MNAGKFVLCETGNSMYGRYIKGRDRQFRGVKEAIHIRLRPIANNGIKILESWIAHINKHDAANTLSVNFAELQI